MHSLRLALFLSALAVAAEAKQDYYSVLGVSRRASAGDIKSAWRRLSLKLYARLWGTI